MKKVIFLDFDGVLNNSHWVRKMHKEMKDNPNPDGTYPECAYHDETSGRNFDPTHVRLFNRILEAHPDLFIVYSTSWRVPYDVEELNSIMRLNGIPIRDEQVLGRTPPSRRDERRGIEIQRWMDENPDDYRIAILDDDADMDHLMDFLFKSAWDVGLTRRIADRVIHYFTHGDMEWKRSSPSSTSEKI